MSFEPKLSLAMIVGVYDKESLDKLEACMKSIYEHVDEFVVALDSRTMEGTRELIEKYNGKCYDYTWDETRYEGARRFSFSKVTGEAVLWLDGDDVVPDGAEIRRLAYDKIINGEYDVVGLPYRYSFDREGNCICILARERIVRNGTHEWVGDAGIHERMVAKTTARHFGAGHPPIIHNEARTAEDIRSRQKRIFEPLAKKLKEEGPDALNERAWYYLAISAAGSGRHDEAYDACRIYWHKYGSRTTSLYIYGLKCVWGDICVLKGRTDEALTHFMWCICNHPQDGMAYQKVSDIYASMKLFILSRMFAEQGAILRPVATVAAGYNPDYYDIIPCRNLARAYYFTADLRRCKNMVEQGLENRPKDDFLLRYKKLLDHTNDTAEKIKSFDDALQSLSPEDGKKLVDMMPTEYLEAPVFGSYTYQRPRDFDKDIVYLNRPSEPLSPFIRNYACGGSEEALVLEAEEMARRGYKVTVYAQLRDGVQNVAGVRYLPFDHFQPKESYGIVVAYRSFYEFDCGINAKYKVIALQDVIQEPAVLTGPRLKEIDLVRCSTNWHAEGLSEEAMKKVRIVPYGIIPEEYNVKPGFRNPYRCFYSSRPERGLLQLLKTWPKIKQVHQEATLSVYFYLDEASNQWFRGSTWYGDMIKEIQNCARELSESGQGLVLSYVSRQPNLLNVLPNMGCWLYPTDFDETFCFSAVKAQAAGCYPVAITRAALQETVHPDYQIKDEDEWLEKAIHYIGRDVESERQELRKFALPLSVKNSVDHFEKALQEIRDSRKEPKVLEPVGA